MPQKTMTGSGPTIAGVSLAVAISCVGRRLVLGDRTEGGTPGHLGEELGVPVGSIGPTRIRCLEKLRKTPAVLKLVDPRPVGGGGVVGVEGRSGVGKR